MPSECMCEECRHHGTHKWRCQFKLKLDDSMCDHPNNKFAQCEAHTCPVLMAGGSLIGKYQPLPPTLTSALGNLALPIDCAVKQKCWKVATNMFMNIDSTFPASSFCQFDKKLSIEHILDSTLKKNNDTSVIKIKISD